MSALPHETRQRLAKLIPLLASDKDGEVVAAARAIERALGAVGKDHHDLTALLVGRQSGWTPGRWRQTSPTTGTFSYADTFKESEPLFEGPELPEALTRKFGLPVYVADRIEPWPEVARHCLHLNRTLPAKHGGKFLEPWQKHFFKTLIDDRRQPTNRHVEMIEKIIARLHQARDAAARATS